MSDTVNHPKHYNSHPSGVECITIAREMGFNIGNVMKYLWRADHKHEIPIEDFKKAAWYLNDEINRQHRIQGIEQKVEGNYDQTIVDAWQDWNYLRPEVRAFATNMEKILRKHDLHKGDSWLSMSIEDLLVRVKEELTELECLFEKNDKFPEPDPEIVLNESTDVANMVMFLAFVYDRMKFVGEHIQNESRSDSDDPGEPSPEKTDICGTQELPEVQGTLLAESPVSEESQETT